MKEKISAFLSVSKCNMWLTVSVCMVVFCFSVCLSVAHNGWLGLKNTWLFTYCLSVSLSMITLNIYILYEDRVMTWMIHIYIYVYRLLVGAPREKVQVSDKTVGGAIYRCDARSTSEDDCTRLDQEPFSKHLFSTQPSTFLGFSSLSLIVLRWKVLFLKRLCVTRVFLSHRL